MALDIVSVISNVLQEPINSFPANSQLDNRVSSKMSKFQFYALFGIPAGFKLPLLPQESDGVDEPRPPAEAGK